jgi:xylan 1,4-beta-xylosidase
MNPIEFRCSLDGPTVPLPHIWERVIGSDHALMALRADYQAQLLRCHRELGIQAVRFHGLLSDDVGTVVRHQGRVIYSFHNAHTIWDFLLSHGMRPFVELSFMPTALASGNATVFHYRGNITPPADLAAWGRAVKKLATSAVDRYGADEASRWPFEVWNEPNLRAFWTGTKEEYWRLYARSARALKSVHPDLQVGGPATAKNEWIEEFLDVCERRHVPVDFVSTHHYPTDPLADFSDDTVVQLSQAQRGFLREQAQDARRFSRGKPLYYTEWNTSSNGRDPLHDEPYAAAFIVKTLLDGHGLTDAYAFWTFSDLFEESYFPSVPFHGGFGLLTIHGLAKPSYRAFQLLRRLGTRLVTPMDGMHPNVDAWVVRKGRRRIAVVVTNHAYPKHPIKDSAVVVHLETRRRPAAAELFRIDELHANPKSAWRSMGSPGFLSHAQVEELHAASTLTSTHPRIRQDESFMHVEVQIPPHGVAVTEIELTDA